ncbi:hypothetical protein ACFP1Z_21360 [Streptomyces gamaensis]|uniref:Uncharacterized protein n=1 Tax=Streptomyces gamaensis TaxID=1763542 RepID=A0ABW0Z1K4_9ACTN
MNRNRAAAAAAVAALLWPAPAWAATAPPGGEGRGGVQLLLNSAFDNRPGGLLDIDVRGLPDEKDVTVTSPVFPRPVPLARYDLSRHDSRDSREGHGHHARPALATTVRPGTYPLAVRAAGRVVAEENVEVVPARPPEFRAGTPGGTLRPGERLWLAYDDLYPGESGTSFTVRSPAFGRPVRLAHDPGGADWHNPRLFSAAVDVPQDAPDGTYPVRLAGADGRVVAEKQVTVRAARPGDDDYVGHASGPAFFDASGTPRPDRARTDGHRVRAGGAVGVLWRDEDPDPGEDGRLTATSPAFVRPVALRRDDSKAGDGDDPRYLGPARIREDLRPGRYPVTVVSHHGRVRKVTHLLVDGAPRTAAPEPGSTALIAGAGTATAALAAAAAFLLRKRAARKRPS